VVMAEAPQTGRAEGRSPKKTLGKSPCSD
jgi:hypothetical protein